MGTKKCHIPKPIEATLPIIVKIFTSALKSYLSEITVTIWITV